MVQTVKYDLGIDLGGTDIKVGVIREDYTIAAKHSVPTPRSHAVDETCRTMAQAAKTALKLAGLEEAEIEYAGIGVPSTINRANSHVVFANNLGWRDIDLIPAFRKHWDIPVYLANDADCAALAEVRAGAARRFDNAVMLTLGTGVGGGLILNRRLYPGGDGFGSEPGHTLLVAGGEPCTCGGRGCLEAYASVTALVRDTIRAMAGSPETLMREHCGNDITRVTGRTAFDAAKCGDETAKRVVENYIGYLAAGIASLAILLRPQAVILGGGVANEGESLLTPLREKLPPLVYGSDIMGVPEIVGAQLGNDAGIIGAALLGA
jgi:glucokinase